MDRFQAFSQLRACVALLTLGFVATAYADELRFDQKYIERIKQSQETARLSVDSFGEQVNLKDGGVVFNWTDIDIAGNSKLPVRLQRSIVVEDQGVGRSGKLGGFGVGGSLDVPYLKGIFSPDGWQVYGSSPNSRCSQPAQPPNYNQLTAVDYASGNWLHIPGSNEQQMLMDPASQLPAPGDGTRYPWITKGFWRFSCLANTKNGYPGEGFVALSPEGDKYYFDWVVSKIHSGLSKQVGNLNGSLSMPRLAVFFLATRVEDRFGNWVTYTYNGDQLSRIDASDGRYILVTGTSGDNITSVRSSIGTWTYAYGDQSLVVNQPDNAQSRYVQTGLMDITPLESELFYENPPQCEPPAESAGGFTYAVTLPSNATATYIFSVRRHFRSNIYKICNAGLVPKTQLVSYEYLTTPNFSDTFTLLSKSISGPGLPTMQWSYTYDIGSQGGPFQQDCQRPTFQCHKYVQTEVRGPDNDFKRYTFGVLYNVNEGWDLGVETGSITTSSSGDTANILSKSENEYIGNEEVANQPFPSFVGSGHGANSDDQSIAGLRPLKRTTITQDGGTFQMAVNSYDVFARPTSVTRSSAFNTRSEATAYYDNVNLWVIGQIASVTKTAPGDAQEMYASTYDAATALPTRFSRFGKTIQSVAYNADGTVSRVNDGNGNATSLSGWKRGLPQGITYADGSSDSAVIDDRGLISSATDENGYTTSYTYDAMGRLTSITYPWGDTVDWATTGLTFEQVNVAEFGLPAGHWRHTVSTGNATKITYLDGLWRPVLTQEYDAANIDGTRRFDRFIYDHQGHTLFASYPGTSDQLSTGTWTQYNALGRPTSVSHDSEQGLLTTKTEYLSAYQMRVTDPRGNQTLSGYQVFDQPGYDAPVWIQHSEGANTDINRDIFGKPLSIRRRNADGTVSVTRSYVYDTYQQLCKTVEPETGATAKGYDAAGNLVWSAAGLSLPSTSSCDADAAFASGRRVDRSYDVRNRIKTLNFPDGNGNQTWSYWPDGLVKQITTINNGIPTYNSYTYNKRRLLIGESQDQADGETWAMGYAYDANGHLAAHRYPSGQTVDYAPNALGQPTQAGSYATGVSYYPNGAIKQFNYGNGIVHTLTQNARQLPDTSQDAYGGIAFLNDGYDYDAGGNVASISDGATGRNQRGNRNMAYDGLDRLTSAVSPMFGTASYSYDALDNLTHVVAPGRDHYYCYDVNWQLANVKTGGCGGSTVIGMSYDPQGNLNNKNGQGFEFDYGNRLRQATGKETYRYDGNGRRTLAIQNAGNIGSLYDQAGALRYQKNQRQSKATDYILLGGSLVAEADWPLGQTSLVKDYLSWGAVAGATRYLVEESVDGVTWTSIYDGNQTNWTSLARSSGSYSYRVTACTANGPCSTVPNVNYIQGSAIDIVPLLYQLLLNS
ncbi:RHS repeat domain-containing protein [Xanthomonas albilineans]|uniref:Putative rhs family protein n=1 Tax=Xanthomonas albilineans (strain GPE PC73 / CFBP 7063) TaxID=380358 RepID=D2U976_XANAP|nr:RHS repeat protein [Xanthomonas albilineans]QHQ29065.1 type IV secretion protein Rhs [Xanthomonas albilineans]CBA16818.1 putative rhs family protein [Xanthomonas albilineans GPE PC73]